MDMDWSNTKLQLAKIHSTIGGVLRLRSYVPLEGEGLKAASGSCPNPLYAPAEVKEPLLSSSLSGKPTATVKRVYEYDLETEAGQDYLVYQQGTAIEEIMASDEEQAGSSAESTLYDLQGRMTKGDNKGIYIEKIFKDGKTNYRKIWKN